MSVETVAKGETVVLLGFTGMRIGEFEVTSVTKSQLQIVNKVGATLIFNRKTGIQVNVVEGKEKYANKVVLPKDAPVNKSRAAAVPAKKAEPAKATKKAPVVEEDDEDEEVPAPKAKAKAPVVVTPPAKTTKKKPAPVVEEEDDDDYEEM